MLNYRNHMVSLLILLLLVVGVACKDTTKDSNGQSEKEIVQLEFAFSGANETFNERFKEPVEKHFDHILLKHIEQHPGNSEQLEEMIASKNIPDLWITSTGSSTGMFQRELAQDLQE